jgi:hypothetical protein
MILVSIPVVGYGGWLYAPALGFALAGVMLFGVGALYARASATTPRARRKRGG